MKQHPLPRFVSLMILFAFQFMVFLFCAFVAGNGSFSAKTTVSLAVLFLLYIITLFGFAAFFHAAADKRARKNYLLGKFASEVNRAILLNEDESKVFSTVLDYAFQILENVKLGSILYLREPGILSIAASQGISEEFVRNFRLPIEDSFQYIQSHGMISRETISRGTIISAETIKRYERHLDSSSREYKSIISVPLFVGDELYGFLNLDSERANNFGPDDLDLLKNFGSQIEVCLLARQQYKNSLAKSRLDGLTGVFSRLQFEQFSQQAFDHAKRYNERFVLGMFDVDNLKTVNDTLGHQAGDSILTTVAEALKKSVRSSDVIGRYGGDEFVGLYFNTSTDKIAKQVSRVNDMLKESPLSFSDQVIAPSFCFGFAGYPSDANDLAGLITIADSRLYAMKTKRHKEP